MKVEGATSVFEKLLERGIVDSDNKKATPKDGAVFLNSLKKYLEDQGLDVLYCSPLNK